MENLVNIETPVIKHSFFKSKEHYLDFQSAWKKSIADGYHIRELYTDGYGVTLKNNSLLTSAHHLIYNALRKRDIHKSYAPIKNQRKLFNSKSDYRSYSVGEINPYLAFDIDRRFLDFAITQLNRGSDWAVNGLKRPFGDTVTNEMLIELNAVLKTIKL